MSICATESMFHGSHWRSEEWQCSDGNLGFSTDLPSKSEYLKVLQNPDQDPTFTNSRTTASAATSKCKECKESQCQCTVPSNEVSSSTRPVRAQVSVQIGQLWSKKCTLLSASEIHKKRPIVVKTKNKADDGGSPSDDDERRQSNEKREAATSSSANAAGSLPLNGGGPATNDAKNVDVSSSREFRKEDQELIQCEEDVYRFSLKAKLALDALKKRDEKDLYRFEYAGDGVLTKLP